MFDYRFFKADSSTFVMLSKEGKVQRSGMGLSFWYDKSRSSIVAVPTSAQEALFVFNLNSADFQAVRVQGHVTFSVGDPVRVSEIFNFNLKSGSSEYVSDDPMKLGDRILRMVQGIVRNHLTSQTLRAALASGPALEQLVTQQLTSDGSSLRELGLVLNGVSVESISPTSETSKALEASAREAILQEADDAIYARRKFSVEQERIIQEAELETQRSVQQKQQQIAESQAENERILVMRNAATAHEQIEADIVAEERRKMLNQLGNEIAMADLEVEAKAVQMRMAAISSLPPETIRVMSMANMSAEQVMAEAFMQLATNAKDIGALTITPSLMQEFKTAFGGGQ
ncbi:MAG: SPFH domain-containing protein [Gammaproteobacteria bacterium]|nr:SPFH domain-containing protein [Gammaproteobacteria bacterium]